MTQLGTKLLALGATALVAGITVLSTAFHSPEPALIDAVAVEAPATLTYSADAVTEDVLWLARCIYSETKRPEEQELVAWVIRNRVETGYRGETTYEGVVLDPYQFSAFNAGSRMRRHYTSLTPASSAAGWERALEIAFNVFHAPAAERPFAQTTRHFYSEQSMVGRRQPAWANGKTPVQQTR